MASIQQNQANNNNKSQQTAPVGGRSYDDLYNYFEYVSSTKRNTDVDFFFDMLNPNNSNTTKKAQKEKEEHEAAEKKKQLQSLVQSVNQTKRNSTKANLPVNTASEPSQRRLSVGTTPPPFPSSINNNIINHNKKQMATTTTTTTTPTATSPKKSPVAVKAAPPPPALKPFALRPVAAAPSHSSVSVNNNNNNNNSNGNNNNLNNSTRHEESTDMNMESIISASPLERKSACFRLAAEPDAFPENTYSNPNNDMYEGEEDNFGHLQAQRMSNTNRMCNMNKYNFQNDYANTSKVESELNVQLLENVVNALSKKEKVEKEREAHELLSPVEIISLTKTKKNYDFENPLMMRKNTYMNQVRFSESSSNNNNNHNSKEEDKPAPAHEEQPKHNIHNNNNNNTNNNKTDSPNETNGSINTTTQDTLDFEPITRRVYNTCPTNNLHDNHNPHDMALQGDETAAARRRLVRFSESTDFVTGIYNQRMQFENE